MKRFVKLFFTLILVGSINIVTIPTSAEETPESPASETPASESPAPETPTDGEEWDGIINDPAPITTTPTTNPTPTPTPLVVTNVVTTVTPPPNTPAAPKVTTRNIAAPSTEATSPIPSNTPAEAPAESPISTEPEVEPAPEPESPKNTNSSETPEIPNTFAPTNDTTRKITLLALISTAIVYFLGIEIWGLTSLFKTIKTEKLLESARQKATKVKKTKVTRSAA